jgi:hypothetical protein
VKAVGLGNIARSEAKLAPDAADDVFRGVFLGGGKDIGPGGVFEFLRKVDPALAFSRTGGPLLVNKDLFLADAVEQADDFLVSDGFDRSKLGFDPGFELWLKLNFADGGGKVVDLVKFGPLCGGQGFDQSSRSVIRGLICI